MDAWYTTIIYQDGSQEVEYTEDRPRIDSTGTCLLIGGDGSYRQRGNQRGIPLSNIKEWRSSKNREEHYP